MWGGGQGVPKTCTIDFLGLVPGVAECWATAAATAHQRWEEIVHENLRGETVYRTDILR